MERYQGRELRSQIRIHSETSYNLRDRYYAFNNTHEKITRFWLAESSFSVTPVQNV